MAASSKSLGPCWLALVSAVILGCSSDEPARIQLHVTVEEGGLTYPPWLTVKFQDHGEARVDPDSVLWHKSPPPMAIDLQFQVAGVGAAGVAKVDVQAFKMASDDVPVLTASVTGVKPGTVAAIPLRTPETIVGGDGGMPDADNGADGGVPEVGGKDAGDAGGGTDGGGGDVGTCDDAGGQDAGRDPSLTCNRYCDLMAANCMLESSSCQRMCTQLRWEELNDSNPLGDNLRCRIENAMLAEIPIMTDVACGAATWNGLEAGGCGTPCDVLCDAGKLICPGDATFGNVACADACRGSFTTAILDCRVQALIDGDCGKASSGTGCP